MSHTIVIERELCSGFGACLDAAPGLVVMGDDGIAVVVGTPGDREAALAVARSCPMAAIRVMDEQGAVLA